MADHTDEHDLQAHWERVYATRSASERSWFRPHLETSLAFIRRAAPDLSTPILDVGAGESTLADDLLAAGYTDLTLLDLSASALAATRTRLGSATNISYLTGDILSVSFPAGRFGLWHDRAVFHFLTTPADRVRYVRQATAALRPGGHVILATFALEGPTRCSGLPVQRHDTTSILDTFGPRFTLTDSTLELHTTPSGAIQPFLYCDLLFA